MRRGPAVVGALLTGAVVWAWLAWRDYPQALLLGGICAGITWGATAISAKARGGSGAVAMGVTALIGRLFGTIV